MRSNPLIRRPPAKRQFERIASPFVAERDIVASYQCFVAADDFTSIEFAHLHSAALSSVKPSIFLCTALLHHWGRV